MKKRWMLLIIIIWFGGLVIGMLVAYGPGNHNGYDTGYDTGYKTGNGKGYNDGKTAGYANGKTTGYNQGHTEGLTQGKNDAFAGLLDWEKNSGCAQNMSGYIQMKIWQDYQGQYRYTCLINNY